MWPDNETKVDLIGFKVHADLIRAVITNPSMLPTTIGVFGDWGGGKTSIMRMLEHELDCDNWPAGTPQRTNYADIAVVYVNTWQFEGYDDAKSAMLSAVLTELGSHKRFGPRVRDSAWWLLKSVDVMRATRLGIKHVIVPAVAGYMTGGFSAIIPAIAGVAAPAAANALVTDSKQKEHREGEKKPTENDLEKLFSNSPAKDDVSVRTFRKRFSQMLTDGGIKTLVVLVDDLDRCTPDRIVENLEAVKLFLSADQSAFVIGADRRIVEHAIRARYASRATDIQATEETDRLVKDYLEKLVQVPYSLPQLSTTEIETYMTLLFCGQHLPSTDFEKCLGACNAGRLANRYAAFGYAAVNTALNSAMPEPLSGALALTATAAPAIADGLKGNPRQVKRFMNALLLRRQLAEVAQLNTLNPSVLVKLMILEYVHLDRFKELFIWQSAQDGFPKQLAELESVLTGPKGDVNDQAGAIKIDPKWGSASVRQWVAMEPLLKTIDLRDYFWIARDRLATTFAGISMVPPMVRTVLDGLFSDKPPQRNAAKTTAKTLSEHDRDCLIDQIKRRVQRTYDDKSGFDALRYLCDADVDGAADCFASLILQAPLDRVSPTIGMDLMTLYNAKPNLRSILDPAKDHLWESKAKIGEAARASKPQKK